MPAQPSATPRPASSPSPPWSSSSPPVSASSPPLAASLSFPPPDNIAPAHRPLVSLPDFIRAAAHCAPLPSPPLPHSLDRAATHEQAPCDPAHFALLAPCAAARPRRAPPSLPTLHDLVASNAASPPLPAPTPASSVTLTVVVYAAHTPRKAATLRLPATASLADLVSHIPCPLPGPRLPATILLGTMPRHVGPPAPNLALGQLRLRLGAPYPLRHATDCEHVLVFTDVSAPFGRNNDHVVQPCPTPASGAQHASAEQVQPHSQTVSPQHPTRLCYRPRWPVVLPCHICARRAATRLTVASDPLATHVTDRILYCELCFIETHCNAKGKLHADSQHLVAFQLPPVCDPPQLRQVRAQP